MLLFSLKKTIEQKRKKKKKKKNNNNRRGAPEAPAHRGEKGAPWAPRSLSKSES